MIQRPGGRTALTRVQLVSLNVRLGLLGRGVLGELRTKISTGKLRLL